MSSRLTVSRGVAALLVTLLIAVPLLLPLGELTRHGLATWTTADSARLAHVLRQTTLLVLGTVALALPLGAALAVALVRCDFPLRRLLLGATLLMLFVPLPMITSGWQALFGADGWLSLASWGPNVGRPWTTGLGPAIWVHAVAGLPWVVVFVGIGLSWVERALEDDGLLLGPPWWVLWRVTLPRCRGALGFAAVWLALQTAGEISVTDMMLVSTFAEEVQIQFTLGDRAAMARAVAAALPLALITWGWLAWYVPRLARLVPPLQEFLAAPRRFAGGRWRWPLAGLLLACLVVLFAAPLLSLAWKLGQTGHPPHWSGANAWRHLRGVLYGGDGLKIGWNLLVTAGAGAAIGGAALTLCWLAEDSAWLRRLLIGVVAFAWALPGPIIGLALKDAIVSVVGFEERLLGHGVGDSDERADAPAPRRAGPAARVLYHGPSPAPLLWAYFVRFLPFAVALFWPLARLTPRAPREAARLEGHGAWHEFWTIVWPLHRRAVLGCGVLTAALCLGEVAAAARVDTPDWESYARLLFDRMHYGVDNTVAALCVALLIAIVACAILVGAASWLVSRHWRGPA